MELYGMTIDKVYGILDVSDFCSTIRNTYNIKDRKFGQIQNAILSSAVHLGDFCMTFMIKSG